MFTPENPPRCENYVAAINLIFDDLSDRKREVLSFQFQQPGRTVTAQEIRDHFGYARIGASNILYGTVGRRMAEALPMETEPAGAKRPQYWKSLSIGDSSGEHFLWVMRDELANALIACGKVQAESDGINSLPDVDVRSSDQSATEGRQKLATHLIRERNPRIVAAKKASATSLACEVCGFDSKSAYGEDYCEVHHLIPLALSQNISETTLDDLAIVCANCHRIIHLYNPPLTIDDLRRKVRAVR